MNLRRVACAVGLALATVASSSAVAAADPAPTYLLSLGDSLAAGYQPAHDGIAKGDTNEGYADQLYATLHATQPNLKLVKLGCSGETTTTMINGGICTYDGVPSQVAAAAAFIATHPGQVKYVTNDIGANDVQTCAKDGSIKVDCAVAGITTLSKNLPVILGTLKAAAGLSGSNPTFVGMNYYNPFLAAFLNPGGFNGVFLAVATSLASYAVNTIEEQTYKALDMRVADVSAAFDSYNFFAPAKELPGAGPVPVPVYNICTLTYMCTVKDIHANKNGYAVIANAFVTALDRAPAAV